MKIKADQLVEAISGTLSEYDNAITDGVAEDVLRAGKLARKEVKAKSPKKSGAYQKSWSLKRKKSGLGDKVTGVSVYNAKHWRRTHLLENGHQKANGGRVEGVPHILPAEQAAERQLLRDVENTIRRTGV